MKTTVILCNEINRPILEETIHILKELWEEMGYEALIRYLEEDASPDKYMNELYHLKEEFVVTFAMAGFEWRGLMEQVRFNTLAAMQVHILIGELPQYDYFLQKEFGIHSFFFSDSENIVRNWKTKYPLVPFLKKYPSLCVSEHLSSEEKRVNRERLKDILQTVMKFIEKPSVL